MLSLFIQVPLTWTLNQTNGHHVETQQNQFRTFYKKEHKRRIVNTKHPKFAYQSWFKRICPSFFISLTCASPQLAPQLALHSCTPFPAPHMIPHYATQLRHLTAVVPPSLDSAAGVSSKDVLIDPATGVSARLYLPKLDENPKKIPLLIYFHGGGFCVDSAFSPMYHSFLNPFAAKSHTLIVSVNYRLAPEHKLPAAYHDSWAALSWAVSAQDPWIAEHGDTERIFIAGDSAGGNIAHEMAVRATAAGLKIEGMILIHSYFGKEAAEDGEKKWLEEFWRFVSGEGVEDLKNNPMRDEGKGMRVEACQRVMVCVAGNDSLRETEIEYFEALKGVKEWGEGLEFVETEGEEHVFHLNKPGCDKGEELVEKMAAFINK